MKNQSREFLITLLSLALVACGGSSTEPDPTTIEVNVPPVSAKINPGEARLQSGLSCDALKAYIVDTQVDAYLSPKACTEICTFNAVTSDPTPTLDTPSDLIVSETNVQEAGVDESDIIKADSQGTLYIASNKQLLVAKGFPADELEALSDYQFDERIRSLFLDEARSRLIVIFESVYNYGLALSDSTFFAPAPIIDNSYTQMKFFDTTDPESLVEIDSMTLSGYNISERYIDGNLYLVTSNRFNFHSSLYDEEFADLLTDYNEAVSNDNAGRVAQLTAQVRSRIQSVVDAQPIDKFLPAALTSTNGAETRTPVLDCTDIYKPDVSVALSMPTIYKINSEGQFLEGLGAIASIADVYASENNLYLWQSSNNWWLRDLQDDETVIHQISLGEDAMQYVGLGIVPGTPNNRFNFSEHNGYLRVATSERLTEEASGIFGTNHMHVLRADGQGDLAIVGKTQTYADNERIFSARFMGDRGFVVTFLQIDPLFSFDLSVPESPRITGELKIPGFSEYIHPVGENYLLTVGQNGDDNGILPGVRLQLFDVSDLSNPMLLHSYVPASESGSTGYAWSIASYDPRAFTYFAQDNLLSIPITLSGNSFYGEEFSGFIVMEVTANNGFIESGRIDHDDLSQQHYCNPETDPLISGCALGNYANYVQPRRTVVMKQGGETFLYTMSDVGLKASPANQPGDSINSISFFGF